MKVEIHKHVSVGVWTWPDLKETEDVCGICRQDFECTCPLCWRPGVNCPPMIGVCTHAFHKHCIDRWLVQSGNTCPMCRQPFLVADRRRKVHNNNGDGANETGNTWAPSPTADPLAPAPTQADTNEVENTFTRTMTGRAARQQEADGDGDDNIITNNTPTERSMMSPDSYFLSDSTNMPDDWN